MGEVAEAVIDYQQRLNGSSPALSRPTCNLDSMLAVAEMRQLERFFHHPEKHQFSY